MPEIAVFDETCLDDQYVRYRKFEPPTQRAEVYADSIKLTVGTFEANLDAMGMGTVTVDGKPLKVVRMLVEATADGPAKVQLDLLCVPPKT